MNLHLIGSGSKRAVCSDDGRTVLEAVEAVSSPQKESTEVEDCKRLASTRNKLDKLRQ